jgi:hypothetical protein
MIKQGSKEGFTDYSTGGLWGRWQDVQIGLPPQTGHKVGTEESFGPKAQWKISYALRAP